MYLGSILSLQQVHYNIGKLRAEKGQAVIAEKFYREAIRYRVQLINTHCTGLFLDN